MTRQGETTGFVLVPSEPTEAMLLAAQGGSARTVDDDEDALIVWKAMLAASPEQPASEPIDMLLFCPKCHLQHVDEPDERTADWSNPPHRSHLCHGCGTIWRPADVPTNGVREIATKGKADTWSVLAEQPASEAVGGGVCATCGFPWGRDPVRHAEFCNNRVKAEPSVLEAALTERSTRVDLPTDRYGETCIDRLTDLAENGTIKPQLRADLRAILALAHPAESANCPVGGEAQDNRISEVQPVSNAGVCEGGGRNPHVPGEGRSSPPIALPPAGAGDVGYARGVEDAAKVAETICRECRGDSRRLHNEGEHGDSYHMAMGASIEIRRVAKAIRALSARRDAQ